MPSASNRPNRSFVWPALFVVAVAVGGYFAWSRFGQPHGQTLGEPDMVAVLELNNRGVGYMEHFKTGYPKAVEAFQEVVKLAPNWAPGRINLGIALLNTASEENLERALQVFREVLEKEPDNPYANYCTGIILSHRGQPSEALPCFEKVTRVDPQDAAAWLQVAKALPSDSERQIECYERAVKLDPYLSGAIYGLAMGLREKDLGRAKALLEEHTQLKDVARWDNAFGIRYSEMGRYATVIGRPANPPHTPTGPLPLFAKSDRFQVKLAPGARWATAADLGQGPAAEFRRKVRARFGATLVVLDYNRDGRPDLLLLGAVVENGQVRDLLLRGEEGGAFTDVTAEAGLAAARPSLGCCVADFDNDGLPDLFITGVGAQWLFRNTGKGGFEDVTAKGGLDAIKGVCLGAAFADLDQDGDLDLVLTQYGATAEEALAALDAGKPTGGLAIWLNVGEAKPASPSQDPPPLTPAFRRFDAPAQVLGAAAAVANVVVSDVDGDQDVDLLVLADRAAPAFVRNGRLLRFQREAVPEALLPAGRWNGALTLDANHDGRADLLVVGPGQAPVLLLSKEEPSRRVGPWFRVGATDSPPLLQAQAVDLDYDGWTDVVGLSEQRLPVLLHHDGERLVHAREALGRDADWPKDLVAVAVAELTGDQFLDLLVWSESAGLQLYASQGNGNTAVRLELFGHRRVDPAGEIVRCNADGVGAWVIAQAGPLWTGLEYTTLSAGLGQSRPPVVLGLGPRPQPDVVRLRWPDNCWQAEFGVQPGRVVRLEERNRKDTSCPVLFTWDGRRFVFVTDFLGAGSVGEALPDGGHRRPRGEEAVKIEGGQLAPADGHYLLKVAEPMDEVVYLDRLQLAVLDHPADVRVYPDERFGYAGPLERQELFAFRKEIYPVTARDHRGRDVTATLRAWDRDAVRDYARRTWLGFAEEHWVELDFGDRLAAFGPRDRLVLCLAGWTDYVFPESLWAATQAGIAIQPPVLEKQAADGSWQLIAPDLGFPAGLPRMMTLNVTGKIGGPRCVLRLRTNLCVYWDQVFVAPLLGRAQAVRETALEVASAALATRGCAQEFSPDGRQPTIYDHDRLEPVPAYRPSGCLTRLGDVTELLRATDDRFVVFGPGDEVTVRFDARRLPEPPAGWTRSFVLRTWGYSKDTAPFTAHGDTVEPLPFRGMSNYPYGPNERHPHPDYQRQYNTRLVGPRR
jgi:FG-GAP-like repeat/Tetratricopeptide repeat